MKYSKFIYGICTALIIAGAIIKILHLPISSSVGIINTVVFGLMFTLMAYENESLKKKIRELEN
ncbi:MAG: hypothetical protein OCD76_00990 [Reichenbachiella sp.]